MRFQHLCPLNLFRLFLPRHGVYQVLGRGYVLNFHPRYLNAPGVSGLVNYLQQMAVDSAALGLQIVQSHGPSHGAQVGGGQVNYRQLHVVHGIAGLGRINNLVKDNAIDGNLGVVLGDYVLARHVQHDFLHIHLAVSAFVEGHNPMETGIKGALVTAEAQHRAFRALGDNLNGQVDKPSHS